MNARDNFDSQSNISTLKNNVSLTHILLGLNSVFAYIKREMTSGDDRSNSHIYHSWNGCRAANRNASLQKDKLIVCNAFKSHWKPHSMRDRWQAHLDINPTTIHYSVSNEKFICPNETRY